MDFICTIEYKNKINRFNLLNEQVIHVQRTENNFQSKKVIETYANNWFLGFIKENTDLISVRNGNDFIPFKKNSAILIPPHHLVEWRQGVGKFQWQGFFSKLPLPSPRPNEMIVFPYAKEIPKNFLELTNELLNINQFEVYTESKSPSSVSEKTKKAIIASYKDDLKITQLANLLKIDRSVMCRAFQKSYGLSPVKFRHLLRIFEGLKLINFENKSITYSAFDAGFSSLNHFEKHFKDFFGITPQNFSFKQQKNKLII